jgi:hypothetical protein
MQQPPDQRITRSIARDIAQRERLKALLAGSIASLGRSYVVTLEAINAQTGDVMAREQAQAATKEQVLSLDGQSGIEPAPEAGRVADLGAEIRRAAAARDDDVARRAQRLRARAVQRPGSARARSDSAPQARDRARSDVRDGLRAAVGGLREHRPVRARARVSRKAFELRDKVSDREQFFISWRYYRDALQAWDKALDVARTWTATYRAKRSRSTAWATR